MNAIVRQDQLPGMPGPTTLLEVISRAASDPSVDIDKLERLMQMHERMQESAAKAAFNEAMAAAQAEMEPISKNASFKFGKRTGNP